MDEVVGAAATWATKTFEAWGLYADANLKTTKQLTDFAANVAKESVGLYAELQTANLEAMQEGQAYLTKRVSDMPEEMRNPADAYKKNMEELAASSEKVGKLVQSNAQAMLRSGEQYWLTAQKTGTGMQNTCTQLHEKLTALYIPDKQESPAGQSESGLGVEG